MSPSTLAAYAAHTIAKNPAAAIESAKIIGSAVITAAPVVAPIAAVGAVGYGIYKLITR